MPAKGELLEHEGGRRRVTAEFLRPVDGESVEGEPVERNVETQTQTAARQTAYARRARASKRCPQCGERFAGDKWACASCRERHNAKKKKRGPAPRKSRAKVRPRWSVAELAALSASASASNEELAAVLGRSPESVRAKRKALNRLAGPSSTSSASGAGAKPREQHT